MQRLNWIYLTLIICAHSIHGYGANIVTDSSYVRIGKPVPEMSFKNIKYGPSKTFSTSNLHGKPTILYFLSPGCVSSFKHFPEIDQLYSTYKSEINLLMIGLETYSKNIRDVYDQFRRKYNLNLPVAFDSIVHKKYGINAVPHVIWIDPDGIVAAVTNVLDHGYLKKFVQGENFTFIDYSRDAKVKRRRFNPDEPFLIDKNGGDAVKILQRSVLAQWEVHMPNYIPGAAPNKDPLKGLKYLQVIGRELADLYRIAYFGNDHWWNSEESAYGNYHYSPVFEIKDKSKFNSDYTLGLNLFCYSQILPPERRNPQEMKNVLQRDLKNFFGYDVSVETRMMPCLSLEATDKARETLVNRGRPREFSSSLIHVDYNNVPVSWLITRLSYNLGLVTKDLPLIDNTGIQNNIDIQLNCITSDFNEVKSALEAQGLRIVRTQRPMKVIVIKESSESLRIDRK